MTFFRKNLIINAGTISLLLLVVILSIYFIISKIEIINSEIVALYSQNSLNLKQRDEFSGLKKDSETANSYSKVMRSAIPLRDDLFNFRTQLEQLARKRNLRFGFTFGADDAGDEKKLGNADFVVSVEGNFLGILSFAKELENFGYLLELSRVYVTGSGENSNGRIDGKIFFKNEVKVEKID